MLHLRNADSPRALLSAVEQMPLFRGSAMVSAHQAIELAQFAEKIGYSRFWVAEHHGVGAGCGAPHVLTAAIGAVTSRIRVGPGAFLLPYYAPLQIAEAVSLLSRLYPDRVDVALGNGPGADTRTQALLDRTGRESTTCAAEVHALIEYNPHGLVPSFPPVELWMVGTSRRSARLAASLGVPYCYAEFIGGQFQDGTPVVNEYRDNFTTTHTTLSPTVGVAVRAMVGDSRSDVRRLRRLAEVAASDAGGLLPAWKDLDETCWPTDQANTRPLMLGTRDEVRNDLHSMSTRFLPDEIFVLPFAPTLELRKLALSSCLA